MKEIFLLLIFVLLSSKSYSKTIIFECLGKTENHPIYFKISNKKIFYRSNAQGFNWCNRSYDKINILEDGFVCKRRSNSNNALDQKMVLDIF